MDNPLLNLSILHFRNKVLVWLMLFILSNSFVPTLTLAQQVIAATSEAEMVETIQQLLQQLGYDPGPIDGMMGEKTRTAIRAFQQDHNLQVDGEASETLVEDLKQAKRKYDQAKEQLATQPDLTSMSPNEIYVHAVQFETQGDIENALEYYNYLMEMYPDHDLAVKAAERVTVLSTPTPQPTATPVLQPTPTPLPQVAEEESPSPTSTPTPTPKSQGMSTGTKVAIGAGALVAVGGVAALAGGGDDSSSTGTSESIGITAIFHTPWPMPDTILQANLSLDGQVIDTQPGGGVSVWYVSFHLGNISVQQGQHTLTITIVSQTSSPNTYEASAYVYVGTGLETERIITLGNITRSLATGQSISWTFTL